MNDNIEWVLVPREPTEAMEIAHRMYGDTSDWWNAVVSSAPKPEAQAADYSDSPTSREAAARILLADGWKWEANKWQQPAGTSDQSRFNTWAKNAGLITESSGLRFVNAQCDTARLAWQAALSTPASHDAQQTGDLSPNEREQVIERLREVYSALHYTRHYSMGKACGRMADGLAAKQRTALAQQPAVVGDGVRPFAWYRPRGDQEPEFRTSPPPEGHGWLPVPGFTTSEKLDAALTPAATPGDPEWEECPECSIGNGMRRGCDICDGSGSVPAAQKEGNGNGR